MTSEMSNSLYFSKPVPVACTFADVGGGGGVCCFFLKQNKLKKKYFA
uniref:Uncharacterized protein n=1 Tax=Anguilla anguilla TaxID=7936 RepID=A0A0E9W4U2_ANGAN